MSRIIEPPKQHIHRDLCHELNEMSIRIKVQYLVNVTPENQENITKVRQNRPKPTWDEIVNLLERCYTEMNQCTKPYKIH